MADLVPASKAVFDPYEEGVEVITALLVLEPQDFMRLHQDELQRLWTHDLRIDETLRRWHEWGVTTPCGFRPDDPRPWLLHPMSANEAMRLSLSDIGNWIEMPPPKAAFPFDPKNTHGGGYGHYLRSMMPEAARFWTEKMRQFAWLATQIESLRTRKLPPLPKGASQDAKERIHGERRRLKYDFNRHVKYAEDIWPDWSDRTLRRSPCGFLPPN